jgi:GTP-binding protein EngB required for normal cell division
LIPFERRKNMSAAAMQASITLAVELTAKALIKRMRMEGKTHQHVMKTLHQELQVLEKGKLATSRDMDVVQAKIDGFIMEVDKAISVSKKKFLQPKHFKGLNEAHTDWVQLLLVLYNAKVDEKYSNAQLILYDREDEDEENIIIAAITFTGSQDPDDLRRMAAFARRATECGNYLVDAEVVPNADPTNRDSKVRSVLNELVIVAGEKEGTSCIEFQLSKQTLISRSGQTKVFNITLTGQDGFANLQGAKEEIENIANEEERYAAAEEILGERVQQIKNANDVYFLGLTGEGKSTLINAILGEKVTSAQNQGVGTTRMEKYEFDYRGKVLRLWDLPGPDDQFNMDEYNIQRLRAHLRNEQQVSSVILVNRTGRNLKKTEQKALLLYKEFFGEALQDIITIVIGMDESDNGVNISRKRKDYMRQVEDLGLAIKQEQVMFIRPVTVGSEESLPANLPIRLKELKDALWAREPKLTAYASWMYGKLMQIEGIRNGAEREKLFKELHAENEKDIKSFCAQIEHYRHATLAKTARGIALEYKDTDPRKWWSGNMTLFRIEINGDNPAVTARIHAGYKRRFGVVQIQMQIKKTLDKLRNPSNETDGKLVMVMTEKSSVKTANGLEIWKEYCTLTPIAHRKSRYIDYFSKSLIGRIHMYSTKRKLTATTLVLPYTFFTKPWSIRSED